MTFPRIADRIAPLGPEARALLESRRLRMSRTTAALTADIAAGIRVLVTRDGVGLTEEQVQERARNIAAALIGNFRIEEEP